VTRLGAVQRFASKDSLKVAARLERFWRTAKETASLYRLQLPLTAADLELRLEFALLYYLCFRVPAHWNAVEPPRARPGDGPTQAPFQIEHLDPHNLRFPILKPTA
jgi:hypothetical protein